jgi:hypothetical protein
MMQQCEPGNPETFSFLGFSFSWHHGALSISAQSGAGRLDRMRINLKTIKEDLRRRIHPPIPEQGLAKTSCHPLLQLPFSADQHSGIGVIPVPLD